MSQITVISYSSIRIGQ